MKAHKKLVIRAGEKIPAWKKIKIASEGNYLFIEYNGLEEPASLFGDTVVSKWDGFKTRLIADEDGVRRIPQTLADELFE